MVFSKKKKKKKLGCISAELLLCRDAAQTSVLKYDIKQSDGEASVMLELWGTWSTPSLPLLPSPFRLGVVASGSVLSMGQIELKLCTYDKLNCLK